MRTYMTWFFKKIQGDVRERWPASRQVWIQLSWWENREIWIRLDQANFWFESGFWPNFVELICDQVANGSLVVQGLDFIDQYFSSSCMQQPRSLTRFLYICLEISRTSSLNSSRHCPWLLDCLFTAIYLWTVSNLYVNHCMYTILFKY